MTLSELRRKQKNERDQLRLKQQAARQKMAVRHKAQLDRLKRSAAAAKKRGKKRPSKPIKRRYPGDEKIFILATQTEGLMRANAMRKQGQLRMWWENFA